MQHAGQRHDPKHGDLGFFLPRDSALLRKWSAYFLLRRGKFSEVAGVLPDAGRGGVGRWPNVWCILSLRCEWKPCIRLSDGWASDVAPTLFPHLTECDVSVCACERASVVVSVGRQGASSVDASDASDIPACLQVSLSSVRCNALSLRI